MTATENEKLNKDFAQGILNSLVDKKLICAAEKARIENSIDKDENH